MNLLRISIVFLFFVNLCVAQKQNDTIIASRYYSKADSLLILMQVDSSMVYFKKALPIYKKAKLWERVASCYNGISAIYAENSKYQESLDFAEEALKICNRYIGIEGLEKASAYDNIGKYHAVNSNYEESLEYYKKALNIRLKIVPEDHFSIANSYKHIANYFYYRGKYKKALAHHEKALDIRLKRYGPNHLQTGEIYTNIGVMYDELGESRKALDFCLKQVEIIRNHFGENHLSLGLPYNNIGNIYSDLSDSEMALEYLNRALTIFIKEHGVNSVNSGVLHLNIAGIYSDLGEYNKSLDYNKNAASILVNILGKNHAYVASVYHNIGVVLENKKEYDKALKWFEKSLGIQIKLSGINSVKLSSLYNNIGGVYLEKEDYEKAKDYFNRAAEVINSFSEDSRLQMSDIHTNMGNIYLEEDSFDKAIESYNKALEIEIALFGKKHREIANHYNYMAEAYVLNKNYTKAISYYEKALSSNRKNITKKYFGSDSFSKNYFSPIILLHTLAGKGEAVLLASNENMNINFLKKHNGIYEKADTLINSIRANLVRYQDKIAFSKKTKETYQGAIKAQLFLNGFANDRKPLKKAFSYLEKSKANVLKDLLLESKAKSYSGVSTDLLKLEKELKKDKAYYLSMVNDELSDEDLDTIRIANFEKKLFKISKRQDSLTKILEKKYPEYHQLKYKNNVISVEEVQQQLSDQTTLLEFFTTDSTIYAFTISKNDIAVKELTVSSLTKKIEKFRKAIIDKNIKKYQEIGYQLYQELIAPVKDKIQGDELVIMPDESLWHLNFDLLLSKKENIGNPKELSYLLKEYAITYANSATLLFSDSKREFDILKKEECLAFSFSDSTSIANAEAMSLERLRAAGDDLPGTRKEISAIADIIDGVYFYGSEAVERNFKKHVNQYNILHLALHGEVDNERPENSKLFFTKAKDTLEDNLLYSHELFALDIPAELTVLSACNTGTGKIAKGEGIMSLGNAFQYAGTKSLLLSSWEVSDQTTPELMKNFYTNLKDGMTKSKALQQAKLQYIQNAHINRVHPFYWGGFYLVGDATPIQFRNSTLIYWLIGCSVIGIILLVLFWYKRRVNS